MERLLKKKIKDLYFDKQLLRCENPKCRGSIDDKFKIEYSGSFSVNLCSNEVELSGSEADKKYYDICLENEFYEEKEGYIETKTLMCGRCGKILISKSNIFS